MKKVLLSGASRGIGAACAYLLASKGYSLYLTCKNSYSKLKEVAEKIQKDFPECEVKTFVCDMGSFADVSSIYKEIGPVDILINNAGISHDGFFDEMSPETWDYILRTNLTSCFNTCKVFGPDMIHNKCGKILNVSSIWGEHGSATEVAYSASKGGVNAFTRSLAKELAPSNIQVNAVAFGCIDTDMMKVYSEEDREYVKQEIPAGRFGSPEEAARMILQILESPDYLTGQIVTMDGGFV